MGLNRVLRVLVRAKAGRARANWKLQTLMVMFAFAFAGITAMPGKNGGNVRGNSSPGSQGGNTGGAGNGGGGQGATKVHGNKHCTADGGPAGFKKPKKANRGRGHGRPEAPLAEDLPGYEQFLSKKYGCNRAEMHRNPKKQATFDSNRNKMIEHNVKFELGESNYTMEVNKFADLTAEEFIATQGGLKIASERRAKGRPQPTGGDRHSRRQTRTKRQTPTNLLSILYPTSFTAFDWRDNSFTGVDRNGVQTACLQPVQNQGACNSGWAYAALVSLAARWCIRTGHVVRPSTQEAIDCVIVTYDDGSETSVGCQAADPVHLYDYVVDFGIASAADYPSHEDTLAYGEAQQCNVNVAGTEIELQADDGENGHFMTSDQEINLYQLLRGGPLAVGLNMERLQFYAAGVFSDFYGPREVQGYMTLIGYGTDTWLRFNQYTLTLQQLILDWWAVRSSFGEDWGEEGHVRILRRYQIAGIGSDAVLPVLP
ncbi:PREDICTED: crustapain-like [Priapulus caudatus]|uniref:Crustapain-like n=1 Tax=Priapulus caudatus TaxID=37621 RepID=A0ABM1DTU0_PRICU|nr:PREDICTED: crustapain-like [Priapulus caudatus]